MQRCREHFLTVIGSLISHVISCLELSVLISVFFILVLLAFIYLTKYLATITLKNFFTVLKCKIIKNVGYLTFYLSEDSCSAPFRNQAQGTWETTLVMALTSHNRLDKPAKFHPHAVTSRTLRCGKYFGMCVSNPAQVNWGFCLRRQR